MAIRITSEDEGKELVDAEGQKVGFVTEVDGDTAHVDPDPDITDGLRAMLGWGDADAEDYTVKHDALDHVSDDALHLRGNL
jgi:hypothetical protein